MQDTRNLMYYLEELPGVTVYCHYDDRGEQVVITAENDLFEPEMDLIVARYGYKMCKEDIFNDGSCAWHVKPVGEQDEVKETEDR